MKNILVLGSGMVGSAIALDLAQEHNVTVYDKNRDQVERVKERCSRINIGTFDVMTDSLTFRNAVCDFDLIVSAVPGFLGYQTLKSIIECGKDVVDISFFPEDALELNLLAVDNNVTAIVDCGVAPGLDNIILGYLNTRMKVTDFECLVGGLPKIKKWPFNYKAPFSPVDVIEEYTRPARYVENGVVITKEALSDCEFLEFDHVGTLEAFNSDGLRSIIFTMPHIKNMKEKTLRYPGHVENIKVLKESGFFNSEKITINGTAISALDFTSKILFKEWKLGEQEEELTIMRIILKGENVEGETEEIIFNLYDEYSHESQTSSMARTTGYTATAVANMFLDGLFAEKGVFPPELIGKHEICFNYIMNYLNERNIHYIKS